MANFKALIFDLGSTLMYFDGNWQKVYHNAVTVMSNHLVKLGLKLDIHAFKQEFMNRMEVYHDSRNTSPIECTAAYILRGLLKDWGYPKISDVVIRDVLQVMYRVTQKHWQIEEDAHTTLSALRKRGYCLGLLSNAADDANVQTLVDKAALRSYFDVLYSSAAVGIRKPNPRFFEMALRALKVAPWHTAMIGDMLPTDILGAHNSGLFAVWITRRAEISINAPYLDTIRPDAIIASLCELPSLLDSLEGRVLKQPTSQWATF